MVRRALLILLLTALRVNAQELTPIHSIQGAGLTSPLVGQTVTTTGIVTARRTNGFFLQAKDTDWDQDPNTAEGLFVFTSSGPAAEVQRGVEVRVTGPVSEFGEAGLSLTQIARPSSVNVLSANNPLPERLFLGRIHLMGGAGFAGLERFEGMRVVWEDLIVIAPTGGILNERTAASNSNGIFYAVNRGLPRPLQYPAWNGSPERLRADSSLLPVRWDVATGARIQRLSGVLDFGSGTWTLLMDEFSALGTPYSPLAASLRAPGSAEFTVASFNVQRLFDDSDDPGVSDPVVMTDAYRGRLAKLSLAVKDILRLPDVLALQEVENFTVLADLANRINRDAGTQYAAILEEGNDVGGIDVAFLVRLDRVRIRSVAQEGKDTLYTRPDGRVEILNDRPPLVLRVATLTGERPFTVVVNHLRSRTDLEDPVAGPRVRLKRERQGQFLADLLRRLEAETPEEAMIALGDFNSFEFEEAIFGEIEKAGYTNLTRWLPGDQNYSYLFQGTAQTIDHLLVNGPMRRVVSRIAYTRMNAGSPESWRGDFSRVERVSDHEAVVGYFYTREVPFTQASVVSNTSFLGGPLVRGTEVAIFGSGLPPEPAFLVNGSPALTFYASTTQHNIYLPFEEMLMRLQLGNHIVELEWTDLQPAIRSIRQEGNRLVIMAEGLGQSDGYAAQVVIAGRAAPMLYSDLAAGSRSGVWRLECEIADGTPRNVPVELVVGSVISGSPRGYTITLE